MYFFGKARSVSQVVFPVFFMYPGSFGKAESIEHNLFYRAVNLYHVFFEFSVVTLAIAPENPGLSVVINKYSRVDASPTVCTGKTIGVGQQWFTQSILVRPFRTICYCHAYTRCISTHVKVELPITLRHMTRISLTGTPLEIGPVQRDRMFLEVFHVCGGKHTPIVHDVAILITCSIFSGKQPQGIFSYHNCRIGRIFMGNNRVALNSPFKMGLLPFGRIFGIGFLCRHGDDNPCHRQPNKKSTKHNLIVYHRK
ncbi:MAG: hypothetical protein BWX77_01004 [Bacteroidetes bacterium ADurb.Bin090]|nr:MAG: hypothetical protein BWX77_01004 [Bacteroidetes bacterium ADurb.Bin090]